MVQTETFAIKHDPKEIFNFFFFHSDLIGQKESDQKRSDTRTSKHAKTRDDQRRAAQPRMSGGQQAVAGDGRHRRTGGDRQ